MSSGAFVALTQGRPLAGRKALVTGAAKRIGRAIALTLAQAGAHIVITYNRSSEDARETVEVIEQHGVRGLAVGCDLGRPETVAEAVTQAASWGEPAGLAGAAAPCLDIVVNNAGMFETVELEHLSPVQWDTIFAANSRGPLVVAQAALPWLRASSHTGRIVNLGSLGGLHPWATHAHYSASKAALHMLTQTMAKAWAPEVAVNCVAPGMIVTGAEPGEEYAHFARKTPMQRNGAAEDVAELVLYLVTATPFLTGQIISLDGGLGLGL